MVIKCVSNKTCAKLICQKTIDSFTTLTKCAGPAAPNFDNNLPTQQRRWDVFTRARTHIFHVWPEACTQGIKANHKIHQNPDTSCRSLAWFAAKLAHGLHPILQGFPDDIPFNRSVKVWKGWSVFEEKARLGDRQDWWFHFCLPCPFWFTIKAWENHRNPRKTVVGSEIILINLKPSRCPMSSTEPIYSVGCFSEMYKGPPKTGEFIRRAGLLHVHIGRSMPFLDPSILPVPNHWSPQIYVHLVIYIDVPWRNNNWLL